LLCLGPIKGLFLLRWEESWNIAENRRAFMKRSFFLRRDSVLRQYAGSTIVSAVAFVLFLAPSLARSQPQTNAWPQRNVRLILPFGAGSATDVAARLLGERLSARWNKPVVVDNRPGGDGLVAINAFISAADDHVLLYASSASFLAHPYTQEKVPYNLERDLLPIARISHTVLSIAGPAEANFKTIAEFVARARAEPGKFNVAGAAGVPEFSVDAFVKVQKLSVTKVPYRDVVQAGRDLGENRIQLLSSSYAVVRPLVEANKVRLLAVGGNQRSKIVPNVPSVIEAGFPELAVETTSGFYGPSVMSIDLRKRVAADIVAVANDPTISARITASGQDMVPAGPEELTQTLKSQSEKTAAVAKILGMGRKN
jgi:tripartite-type tricarboxylate transporter receptor subunit TctC